MLQKNRLCPPHQNHTKHTPKLNKPPPLLLCLFGVCFDCFSLPACGVAMRLRCLRVVTCYIYGVGLFGFMCCCFVRLLVVAFSSVLLVCFFCMQPFLIHFVDFGCICLFLLCALFVPRRCVCVVAWRQPPSNTSENHPARRDKNNI